MGADSVSLFYTVEADIVAIMGISLTGVPQTNYEFHRLRVYGNSVT